NFKQGDLSVFEPARPYLESCMLGQKAPGERRSFLPWILLTLILALAGWLIFREFRAQQRWDAYVDRLRQDPGIALTRVERHGLAGFTAGWKDPKAADPARLLTAYFIDPSNVQYEWQPYLSLNTPFAAARAVESDVERIQAQVVRFDVARSELLLSEAGR